MCWIWNNNGVPPTITDGLCGVLNNSNVSNNRLSGAVPVILDAEIY